MQREVTLKAYEFIGENELLVQQVQVHVEIGSMVVVTKTKAESAIQSLRYVL